MVINEAQALALLEEVNPVPDLESYEFSQADIAAYLATQIERSSDMTQDDTKPLKQEAPRRPVAVWLSAAAAVVVIGLAIVLLTQPSEDAATSPTTATTVPDAPSTTVDATPTSQAPPTTVSASANLSSAESFVTALYTNDTEALDSLAFSDADYKDEAAGGAALRNALNVEILGAASCENMSQNLVRCQISSIDDLAAALGLDLYEEVQIVSFTPTGVIDVSWQEPVDATVDLFQAWVFTNYPGTCSGPADSCATDLLSRVDEYLATLP